MGKGKRLRKQVNYGDGEVRGNDDTNWQETMSDYNSDFSMPSDEDQVKKKSSLLKQ
jgi:chromodomain-helicase-DNA-binding protein 4